jgi:hypothetical protein
LVTQPVHGRQDPRPGDVHLGVVDGRDRLGQRGTELFKLLPTLLAGLRGHQVAQGMVAPVLALGLRELRLEAATDASAWANAMRGRTGRW